MQARRKDISTYQHNKIAFAHGLRQHRGNVMSQARQVTIDRSSPMPLYHQLKELLRNEIKQGMRPGQQLPTEQELIQRYQLSRITVIQAIKALEQEGLVQRIRGKGTFVSKPKIEQRLSKIFGFTQELQQRGMQPGTRLISAEQVHVPAHIAAELEVAADSKAWELRRLRLADGEAIAIQTAYIPVTSCPGLDVEKLSQSPSLYRLLREDHGLVATRARESYVAGVVSDPKEARLLQSRVGTPVLLATRTTFDAKGRAFEYVASILRGDRYTLYVDLYEPSAGQGGK